MRVADPYSIARVDVYLSIQSLPYVLCKHLVDGVVIILCIAYMRCRHFSKHIQWSSLPSLPFACASGDIAFMWHGHLYESSYAGSNSATGYIYSKICVKRPLSKDQKLVFKTDYRLIMQVKSITEHSAILRPSVSYHLSLKSLFCLFLSDRFTQVLLYVKRTV